MGVSGGGDVVIPPKISDRSLTVEFCVVVDVTFGLENPNRSSRSSKLGGCEGCGEGMGTFVGANGFEFLGGNAGIGGFAKSSSMDACRFNPWRKMQSVACSIVNEGNNPRS